MHYCIIGGCGFIGSHVVDAAIAAGHRVTIIDNLVSGHRKFIERHLESGAAAYTWGDIRSPEDLDRVFRKATQSGNKFDRCINLAAQPYIPKCFDDPKLFFETNATGTLNVIAACEKHGVERFLQYASAEEYGTQKGKINELVPIHPQSTYGVSKVAADGLCAVRNRESGINAISLRQFNCYGPRETQPYVIPEIIDQLDKGPVARLGNVKAERDFLYVEDAAQYALELLEKGTPGECYNLGASEAISIEALAKLIGKAMGHDEITIELDPAKLRPWDIERLESDNTKIHGIVSYRPQTKFLDGLKKTVQHFRENGRKWDFVR